ncbi:MAG: hypothetical protein DRP79_03275 [Planctomycetota bacterium]|nr:MAG: hypothetical protein DRP79_03275 [Planctomycetota bacterium]
MPAWEEEVEAAEEEGIKFNFLVAPVRVIPEKDKLKVECVKMELGEPDASGRRRPVPIEGSEFITEVDRLIMGIGQRVVMPAQFGLEADKRGRPIIDEKTMSASKKGVFAGGDMVTGPATVIEGINAGREAARSVDRYLGGTGRVDETLVPREEENPWLGREEDFAYRKLEGPPILPVEERFADGFPEVVKAYDEKTAVEQAKRCLRCSLRLKIARAPMPPEPK